MAITCGTVSCFRVRPGKVIPLPFVSAPKFYPIFKIMYRVYAALSINVPDYSHFFLSVYMQQSCMAIDSHLHCSNFSVKITYPNGDEYLGAVNDLKKRHGEGTYTIAPPPTDEDAEEDEEATKKVLPFVYSGSWINGERSGVGKLSYPSGDSYYGQFEHNMQHGEGTYKYANGDIYSGQWVQGQRSGQGCYEYASNKSKLVGTWVDGEISNGKWIYSDGSCWSGDFKNGKPIGKSTFYSKSAGNQQNGEWVELLIDEADEEGVTQLLWKGETVVKSNVAPSALNRAQYRPDLPEVSWEKKVESKDEDEDE